MLACSENVGSVSSMRPSARQGHCRPECASGDWQGNLARPPGRMRRVSGCPRSAKIMIGRGRARVRVGGILALAYRPDLARTRTRPVPALSAPPAARVAVSSPRAASREGPRPPWAATAGPHLKTGITGARSSRTVLHSPEAGLLPARILLHPARCEIGSGPSAPRRSYGESHAPGSPAASSQLGVLVILERRLLAASFTMGHL
jgi:hypothetical protein